MFRQRFIDAGLIRPQRAAPLKNERDLLLRLALIVDRSTFESWFYFFAARLDGAQHEKPAVDVCLLPSKP